MDDNEFYEMLQTAGERCYNISELLDYIEPKYQRYENAIRWCVAGMADYAAQLAAQGQEARLPQLRRLRIEMAEFWGLTEDITRKGYEEMIEGHNKAFDHAVSEARASGCAPPLTEQTKKNILDGLEVHARELRHTDTELEDSAVECDILAEALKERWQIIAAPPEQTMGGMC